MAEITWNIPASDGMMKRGRKVVEHRATSKANAPKQEVATMLCCEQYGDSSHFFNIRFFGSVSIGCRQ